ncbi:MAG: Omp28 family outer membrane lipoprotein [Muribaculaceae bacterium]|nr:Omp28 family outer membrane lipoprotein [Muribaculaceae bacterium]
MNTLWNKIFFAGASAILASAMVACDNISEDERFVSIDAVVPERVVLIEDFTGQNCSNCPDAHAIIEGLQEQYGDAIVAVSIHGGGLAISNSRTSFETNYIGLANPEGEYYNTKFQVSSWPKGMINHKGNLYESSDWATVVRTELERPSDLDIELEVELLSNVDETTGETKQTISIDVEMLPQADINGALQVWVLESGIVARQTTNNGRDNNYVHNHVLRAAVNGNDGETVSLTRGLHQSASYTIDVRYNDQERWNPDNLSVVAFVTAADGVHQVAKVNVK